MKEKRADYGRKIVVTLSRQLTEDYGNNFNQKNSSQLCCGVVHFYVTYALANKVGFSNDDYDDRISKVKEYVKKPDLSYKKDEWVDEAVKDRKGEDLEASANFENTHWYKFQLAAKAHLAMVMDMLKSY